MYLEPLDSRWWLLCCESLRYGKPIGQPLVWQPLGLQRCPARSPDMWQPKKGFRSNFSRSKNQPKLSAQGLEPGCLLESFLACPWVLQRVVYVQVQFLPDEGGQMLVQVWVFFWKYSQTGWQPEWQYCELPRGAVVTEQRLSAGSTLCASKRLSGLGRLTTGPVEGPWRLTEVSSGNARRHWGRTDRMIGLHSPVALQTRNNRL